MNLLILGASGSTGRELVQNALKAGHDVTAFLRRPSAFDLSHPKLRLAEGDVRRPEALDEAMKGQEAVLCAVGPAKGAPPGDLISTGVRNALAAMARHGARRFIFESGLMVGDGRGMGAPKRWMLALYGRLHGALLEDKVRAESAIRESGLEWVIVRPPTLHHKPPRGDYKVGEDLDISLAKGLSHAEVADFMVKAASDDAFRGRTLDIGYVG